MKLTCSVIVAAVLLATSSLVANVAAERGVSLDSSAVNDSLEVLDDLPDACDWMDSDEPAWTHLKKDDKKKHDKKVRIWMCQLNSYTHSLFRFVQLKKSLLDVSPSPFCFARSSRRKTRTRKTSMYVS